jgi:hypothetical protein
LVEKRPFEEGVQMNLELVLELMGIFWISLTLEALKMDKSNGKFQVLCGVMRSETARFGGDVR